MSMRRGLPRGFVWIGQLRLAPPRPAPPGLAQRRWPTALLCVLWALARGPITPAQTGTDGALGGTILGTGGLPLAGASVVVRGVETGVSDQSRTGSRGQFLLVRLPVGDYLVTVRFADQVLTLPSPVTVHLGEVTEVATPMLSIAGAPASPVSVHSGANSGPSTNAGPGPIPGGARLSEDDLAELPVDDGEWRSLARAAPGANDASQDDGRADLSFRGVDSTQNSSRTDGASADESFGAAPAGAGVDEEPDAGADVVYDRTAGAGSGPNSVVDGGRRAGSSYTFAQAAVREFRVEGQGDAAAYGSALYGHGVGGVITTVSRSGGTRLHGVAFYTLRDAAWAAVNPFSIASNYSDGVVTNSFVRPYDQRQQFGGSLGGPIPTGHSMRGPAGATASPNSLALGQSPIPRLFFFYAFDEQRRNFPAISSPGYAGFYSLTPTQTALLGNRGVSPAKTRAALNYLNSLTGTVARRSDQTVNFARIDLRRPGGSRIVIEYNRARWSQPAGARSGAVVDRGAASLGSSFGAVDAGVLRWVNFFGLRFSNELRLQLGRQLQYESPQTPLAQEPNIGPGGLPPEVSIGPQGLVFGTPAALGQRAYPDERRTEIADVAVWVKGRHLLQFGGDLSLIRDYTDSLTNAEGTFTYDSGATNGKAGGLVDWITDYTFNANTYPNQACPSIVAPIHYFCFRSYSQSFGQQALTFNTQEWAGFVQDDWRLAQRLTLHAGIRYEYEYLPLPQTPNAALDQIFGAVGATGVFPEDRNNFGPRLGLAWQPFGVGRGLLRLGYGVYYGKLPGATIRAALLDTAQPSSVTRIRILPTTVTACPQATGVGFGYACSYLTPPKGVVAATTSALVFDRRFRLPAVQQGTLAIEHSIAGGVLAIAQYSLNLDRQLPNSVDINISPSSEVQLFQLQGGTGAVGVRTGETFAIPVYTSRVSTSFGAVTDLVSNANATYNAVTLEARRGPGGPSVGSAPSTYAGRGLEFRIAWTWSKAIDYGQNSGASPRANGQFDPFNVRYDKGLSALDFPHRVVVTAIWAPRIRAEESALPAALDRPLPAALERALRAATAGWALAGIFSESSGRPYSYDIFGGTRLTGGRESINGSGGSVVLPTVGRNTLRLPDSANLDLRLTRTLRLPGRPFGDSLRLRASAEAFNVGNHVNISGVQQRAFLVGTPASGITPLIFQDAPTVAAEGLNVQPFGAYTAAGTSQARERQIQLSLRLEF